MELKRYPIDQPVERKRIVTLYQVNEHNQESFINNALGRFVGINQMEPVYTTHMDGTVDAILDRCFDTFNNDERIVSRFLNYPMSVGDIIQIDTDTYRCLLCGWEKI